MPSHKQTTVEPVTTERALGAASTSDLQSAFPGSPIYLGDLTNDAITDMGNELLLSDVVNDGGHTFGEAHRDYVDAPTMDSVTAGAGGLPSGPYTPNVASPGEGSLNAADMPEGPAPVDPGSEFGSGVGHDLDPSSSSTAHASHKIGSLSHGTAPGA